LSGRPKEYCGIFGIYGHADAGKLTYFGLYALQHRGQESAGIVVGNGSEVRQHIGMGLVSEVFDDRSLADLPGHLAIGHVRYSTTGSSLFKNAQPFLIEHGRRSLAIGHNGNLVNAARLRRELESKGHIFQTTMDSEVFLHLMVPFDTEEALEDALIHSLAQVEGAYSIVLMTKKTLVGARDPHGFRPLCLGKLNGAYVLASETCALDLVEAEYIRDIEPGEIVLIDDDGLRSIKPFPEVQGALCIFEYIYFARPDSDIFGQNVYEVRKRQGERLAAEFQMDVDLIMPFPDSGNYAALGYAQNSGIPFEMGVIRNHYIGRTFIQPSQFMREFGVRVKLNPVKSLLRGKRVLVVEDSIIRGTTTRTRINTLRNAGAREVHMLVSCPPHRYPCYYGIDFSSRGELIAAGHSVDEIGAYIGLDSLGYLSLDGLIGATQMNRERFCLACFDGNYPTEVCEEFSKYCLEGIQLAEP